MPRKKRCGSSWPKNQRATRVRADSKSRVGTSPTRAPPFFKHHENSPSAGVCGDRGCFGRGGLPVSLPTETGIRRTGSGNGNGGGAPGAAEGRCGSPQGQSREWRSGRANATWPPLRVGRRRRAQFQGSPEMVPEGGGEGQCRRLGRLGRDLPNRGRGQAERG